MMATKDKNKQKGSKNIDDFTYIKDGLHIEISLNGIEPAV